MGKMGKAGGSLAQEIEKEIKTDYFFTFIYPQAAKESGRMVNKDYILGGLQCRVSLLGPTDYRNSF